MMSRLQRQERSICTYIGAQMVPLKLKRQYNLVLTPMYIWYSLGKISRILKSLRSIESINGLLK